MRLSGMLIFCFLLFPVNLPAADFSAPSGLKLPLELKPGSGWRQQDGAYLADQGAPAVLEAPAWWQCDRPAAGSMVVLELEYLDNLTRPVRSFTVLPGRGLLAVGCESGCLCALDEAGQLAWNVPLGSAVTHTALVHRRAGLPLVAAGCKSGKLFLVDADGKPAAMFDCQARLQEMIAADLDGDGAEEIVAATADPHRLFVITTR